jgi:hypothetical protein
VATSHRRSGSVAEGMGGPKGGETAKKGRMGLVSYIDWKKRVTNLTVKSDTCVSKRRCLTDVSPNLPERGGGLQDRRQDGRQKERRQKERKFQCC